MDYTLSNSYDTDAGSGNRMHEDAKAVSTVVSAKDENSVIWSLMEIVKAAGLTGVQFDKANPVSYQRLLAAIRLIGRESGAPGHVAFLAQAAVPSGWLKANGASISRSAYAALFNVIGTAYGPGDGSTTFALPDLRGEFLRGFDDGRGVDSGRAFGSAQAATRVMGQIYDSTGFGGGVGSDIDLTVNGDGGVVAYPVTASTSAYWGQWITITGSASGRTGTRNTTLTRPRNVALLACIKY